MVVGETHHVRKPYGNTVVGWDLRRVDSDLLRIRCFGGHGGVT